VPKKTDRIWSQNF